MVELLKQSIAYLIIAIVLLAWIYIAARLVVAGGARSWFETLRKWKRERNNKQEEDE